ncbi:MAG: UvrD-helicase domain-containing protein [Cryobacterium sp.]|nr:UvrD-helicase domain-containing protein [Oligoflexia bacterium]
MSEVAPRGPTAEQQAVIENWGQGIAVLAGAGSGKTYTLVEKVRALLLRNSEARFAAVSFTEKSASDLRAKLTRLTLEIQARPLQGHVVTTIHGFCSQILREYPREAGFDGDEKMLSEAEASNLWSQALDGLFFEDLPPEVENAFTFLTERESRTSLYALLARVRDLQANAVIERLSNAPELARLSDFVLERYDRLKRRLGALDFNDLELGADRALQVDTVAEDYRLRFDLVMVDEFQDTNPVQARILTRLAKPGLSNLCVVGDPKQSIYRFRDADVTVFEDFCAGLPVRVNLTKNFRSVPGVLEFCNEVCAPAFEASGMEFHALTAGLPEDPSVPPVESALLRGPEDLARIIQGEIAKGVDLSDMALLLRTIRGGPEKWLKALTAAGVPIAIESGGLLWNDPRARELAFFLKWWANPAQEIAGLAFLRSPWIGVSEREIESWRSTDPGMLHSFLRTNHPVANLLRPLRLNAGRVRPGELLLKLLDRPEIENELGVLALALWHRAEELSEEGLDFHRVAERISEACEESRRERAIPPPKNAGQLRVMTVHGSKGLEFPHVLLLDFPEKPTRAKGMPLLFWDRVQGPHLAGRDEEGERLKKDPTEEEWKRLETSKELAESKRVLYVALTRAQKRLLILLPTNDDEKKREQIAKSREKIEDVLKVDFWRGWIEEAIVGRPLLKAGVPPAGSPIFPGFDPSKSVSINAASFPPRFSPRRPRHSVSEWNRLSRCERAYEWTTIRPMAPTEEEEWQEMIAQEVVSETVVGGSEETLSGPRSKIPQSEIGTRVHKALELGDESGLYELEDALGKGVFQAAPIVQWMRDSAWMKEGIGFDKAWRELAFEVPIESETLIGALDRLVRLRDGSYAILDFKITGRRKAPEELLEAYSIQLNLYAWALERLVPESLGKTRAMLIHVAAGEISEIEVPVIPSQLENYREKAQSILRGRPGEPQPSSLCDVCEHLSKCREGEKYVNEKSRGASRSSKR